MCGIVGWIDFSRDLTLHLQTVTAMTNSLRRRGPDGTGVWISPHAAIGHRRLAVLDIAGGAQPMTATRGGDGQAIVLTYNGELYNYRDVRAELVMRGHRFATAGDTEVVLRAYLEWGPAFVDRLAGMYAIGIWDSDRQELILVRDRLGVKPLYYHAYPDGILFASEPKAILANPLFRPRTTLESLPILFNPRLAMPWETPLSGLRQVQPGHLVRVSRLGVSEKSYWQLVSREHLDNEQTTIHNVRDLLEQVVTEQMVADVPWCVLLSGGLDSSAIAAVAAAETATGVSSFSIDFVDAENDFRATPLRPERDTPYALAAAQHIGTDHTQVIIDSALISDAVPATLAARDLPSLGQFDASMYLLFERIRQRRFIVALSGEGADEVFGGYPWFFDPATVWGDTFPWLGNSPRLTDCLVDDVRSRIKPDDLVSDRYATMRARVPRLEGELPLQARMREVLYLSMQGPLQYLLDRTDRMSMAVGVEVRVPFCDHRLLEYVWNIPWDLKTAGGREKSILRSAIGDLLPSDVRNRRKSAYPATYAPEYRETVHKALESMVSGMNSSLAEVLDAGRIRTLSERRGTMMAVADTTHLLLPLVEVDRWLQTYDIVVE